MSEHNPDSNERIALAELKRDLKAQIATTEKHLTSLRTMLQQLEEQNASLQELKIGRPGKSVKFE